MRGKYRSAGGGPGHALRSVPAGPFLRGLPSGTLGGFPPVIRNEEDMLQLDADDRLAIASLQSPRETSVSVRIVREAAILIPCATIFWFARTWGDRAAPVIGFGLYAGYQIYLSFTELIRNRRIGEILISYEEDRQQGVPLEFVGSPRREIEEVESGNEEEAEEEGDADHHETDDEMPGEDEYEHDEIPRGTAADVAACFERASDETALASAHYQTAAKRFRKGNISRGCSHAFAGLGHLQAARREARIAAGIHADHPFPGE